MDEEFQRKIKEASRTLSDGDPRLRHYLKKEVNENAGI